jgi:hypothetical protein
MGGGEANPSSGCKFYPSLENFSGFSEIIFGRVGSGYRAEGATGLRSRVSEHDPIHCFIQLAEHADSVLAIQFAIDFKHSGETELQVVLYQNGSARAGRVDISFGELAHFFRSKRNVVNLSEIRELAKIRLKIRVFR